MFRRKPAVDPAEVLRILLEKARLRMGRMKILVDADFEVIDEDEKKS